jgi:hypothetical protein
MTETKYGIEIEMTGITRKQAAQVASGVIGGAIRREGGNYDTYSVTDNQNRSWSFLRDASITCERKVNGNVQSADGSYSVEMVSPILTYTDMATLQEIIRRLRKAGAIVNSSCGVHIHLDSKGHSPQTVRTFCNLICSRNNLLYAALSVPDSRKRYCKELDSYMVEKLNAKRPKTFEEIADIWYEKFPCDSRNDRYNSSRYASLNLHALFRPNGHKTLELRIFNSTLHAGEIRSYVTLALALNHQSLTQRSASPKQPQTANEKFSMRTWLTRIGLNGDSFKACRNHLTKNLNGSSAWRHGSREQTKRRTAGA